MYCDPPYYLDDDSKMFVGMYPHRNFPIHHLGFKHELLRDLLKKHKGGFILHYKEILFSVLKPKIMKLLYSKITFKQNYNDTVIIYGEATKWFGKWKKLNSKN